MIKCWKWNTATYTCGHIHVSTHSIAIMYVLYLSHPRFAIGPLYHVPISGPSVYDRLLSILSPSLRLHHIWRCPCCEQFIRRYGNLCILDEDTMTWIPILWNPDTYIHSYGNDRYMQY